MPKILEHFFGHFTTLVFSKVLEEITVFKGLTHLQWLTKLNFTLATNDITDKITKIYQTYWFVLNPSQHFSNIMFTFIKLDYSSRKCP